MQLLENGHRKPSDCGIFDGKSILVTGGTGSFGRLFIRTVLEQFRPQRMIVFSRDELKQYEMQEDPAYDASCMRYFLGDVRDEARLVQAFYGVDYVVHAAALKQVPAAEYNPLECIKTNIYGAQNVISAALTTGVQRVVALSTDKAVNPVNLYGATKLASDKLFVAANNFAGRNVTRFAIVRYGNVVGSRGSVLPLFVKLLSNGADELPITDRRMTRFWILLQQGVDFVIDAFYRMHGGEIFVPHIPSARIVDLAEALRPGITLRDIGIRPGEKIHEAMCPRDDSQQTLKFANHYVIPPAIKFTEGFDYRIDATDEIGQVVEEGFEYNSERNERFLSVEELRALHGGVEAGRSIREFVHA